MSYDLALLSEILDTIDKMENLLGTAFISKEGVMLVNHLPSEIEEKSFSAMMAASIASLENATLTIGNMNLKYLIGELDTGCLILFSFQSKVYLIVYGNLNADSHLVAQNILDILVNAENI
jgi:predicted regulator of Ras-like GTPase activity (Roadblock/LC7/MglB family)